MPDVRGVPKSRTNGHWNSSIDTSAYAIDKRRCRAQRSRCVSNISILLSKSKVVPVYMELATYNLRTGSEGRGRKMLERIIAIASVSSEGGEGVGGRLVVSVRIKQSELSE